MPQLVNSGIQKVVNGFCIRKPEPKKMLFLQMFWGTLRRFCFTI